MRHADGVAMKNASNLELLYTLVNDTAYQVEAKGPSHVIAGKTRSESFSSVNDKPEKGPNNKPRRGDKPRRPSTGGPGASSMGGGPPANGGVKGFEKPGRCNSRNHAGEHHDDWMRQVRALEAKGKKLQKGPCGECKGEHLLHPELKCPDAKAKAMQWKNTTGLCCWKAPLWRKATDDPPRSKGGSKGGGKGGNKGRGSFQGNDRGLP